MTDQTPKCSWIYDSDGSWATDCGQAWVFEDGSPTDNGVIYCHHCGHNVLVDLSRGPDEDGEYIWEDETDD